MAANTTTTHALIPTSTSIESTSFSADLTSLIADWHAALDQRVAAGELAPATRSAYQSGAALSVRGDQPGPLFVSLSDRSHGARLSLRALRHLIKGYYLSAGVLGKDKTAHSLRHAAISNAMRQCAPVQKVPAMARHASIETTMIYFHEIDRLTDPAERYIAYGGSADDGGST